MTLTQLRKLGISINPFLNNGNRKYHIANAVIPFNRLLLSAVGAIRSKKNKTIINNKSNVAIL